MYIWNDASEISKLIASDDRMSELITNLLSANFKKLKDQAKDSVVTINIPGTAPNNFIEIGIANKSKWKSEDLQTTFGRARVFGSIKVTIGDKHNDSDKINITKLENGADFKVSDIYDFTYFGEISSEFPIIGTLYGPAHASRVQTGWQLFGEAKDKTAGQVFRNDFKVKITNAGVFQQGVGFLK